MKKRLHTLFIVFFLLLSGISLRLFFWQVISANELAKAALDQHTSSSQIAPKRGEIYASDGFPLVQNIPVFKLTAYTPNISASPKEILNTILPLLTFDVDDPEIATDAAKKAKAIELLKKETELDILEKLTNRTWSALVSKLSIEQKETIESYEIEGLDFEEGYIRAYPEASMSAHTLGFVGKDDIGSPIGYFGLEGYYNRELTGKQGLTKQELDAFGRPLLIGSFRELAGRNGRNLKLHLNRGLQFIVEEELRLGLERFGAVSGEVIIMDPNTGGILAMASLPAYNPVDYRKYDTYLYKNPVIANTYEPGSTIKVLVVAAALNEGAIKLSDKCEFCDQPFTIGKYTIKTWNNEYRPDSTPENIIVHSDNVGMVWIQRKLGGEKLLEYLENFGFGQKTGIDLQEEINAPLRTKWGEIDYATTSFGQGIAITSIQMLHAVSAIANNGILLEPHLVQEVQGDKVIEIETKKIRRVISKKTADQVTRFMVSAVESGESKWTKLEGYKIAGKTGTAQIPVAGHYDEEKTIASFVGFAPADNPQFVMLVKLEEPTSSPWGSETAAPLWFSIAKKLMLHLNIPPS